MVEYGHDISSYQPSAAPAGSFTIVKLTEGQGYINPEAKAQIASALSQGQNLGGYHFAQPGNAVVQAKLFVAQFPAFRPFVPFLDIEAASALPANDPVSFAFTFLTEVRALTGLSGGLYIDEYVLNSFNWDTVRKAGFLLWVADYNAVLPHNVWGATLWQTSDGKGKLDADTFFGDNAKWKALGTPVIAAKPKPVPKPIPKAQPVYYQIQYGDTLDSIATKFNTSLANLVKLNNINDVNVIFASQKIRVR